MEGAVAHSGKGNKRYYAKNNYNNGGRVDRAWSTTGNGTIRGWAGNGTVIEIAGDGVVTRSPYAFDSALTWGPLAFAQSSGSAWQSTDRGQHWTEVMPPPHGHDPSAQATSDACDAVGCDLGGFYRIGWEPIAPPAPQPVTEPVRAPKLPLTQLPAIACSPLGTQKVKAATRTSNGTEDLGLGAQRFTRKESDEYTYQHDVWARVVASPARGATDGSSDGEGEPALRALISGFSTNSDDGTLKASGPVTALSLLRRQAAFLAPFDPQGTVRKGTLGMSEVLSAMRLAGLGPPDSEPMTLQSVVPLLTADAASVADVVFGFQSDAPTAGIMTLMRSTLQTRVVAQIDKQETTLLMGAAAVGDDVIVLEGDDDGAEHVLRWSAGSLATAFDVPAPASSSLYPANPDSVAIGPHQEVAVLRTPSGSEPATKDDPALLYLPGQQPTPLAPWSTLALADDAACKADTTGWHTIVTTTRPWVRGATPDLDLTTPTGSQTFARVRWSPTRVCLEALEVRMTPIKATVMQNDDPSEPSSRPYPTPITVGSWLVWKVLGTAASPAGASRIGVGAGIEMTQPMKCSL